MRIQRYNMIVQGHKGVVTIRHNPLDLATIHVQTPNGSALTTGTSHYSLLVAAQLFTTIYHLPMEGTDAVEPTGKLL